MSESIDDPVRNEARAHFNGIYSISKYIQGFWLMTMAVPMCYFEKSWWYLAGCSTLLLITIATPGFRFLLRKTDWFRVLTAFLLLLAGAAFVCSREQYEKLIVWHLVVSGAVVLFSYPAMKGFCRRFDLPSK